MLFFGLEDKKGILTDSVSGDFIYLGFFVLTVIFIFLMIKYGIKSGKRH